MRYFSLSVFKTALKRRCCRCVGLRDGVELLLLLLLLAAGRGHDLTRLENVPREIFKQIETTQL